MRTSIDTSRGALARLAAVLVILLLLIGCGGAASAPQRLDTVGSGVDGGAEQPPGEQNPVPVKGDEGGSGYQVLDAARPDLLVIKTGTLELQVKSVGDASDAAAAKITALGGYVSGSEHYGDGDNEFATITYRIPADQWTDALAALRSLAIKVVSEITQTQDVTGQVVDLGARITNLQATERALQSIMDQATKITDVLAVQAELTKVRGDIEVATAEKQHLQEQAAFSTLSVRFGLQPEAAIVVSQQKFDPKDQVDRAAASLVEILQGLATAGIWFGIVWLPVLLVLGFLTLVVAVVVRRRLSPKPAGGPGAPQIVDGAPPADVTPADLPKDATPPTAG
jgi:hypothetical protein